MEIIEKLLETYPELSCCIDDLMQTFIIIKDCYRKGGKLLLCGNGGSAADCEHIAGELMKGFLLKRPVPEKIKEKFLIKYSDSAYIAENLQRALPAVPLTGFTSLNTAFANDADPALVYAQSVYALGKEGDVLLGISTSGNAVNVINALITANVLGLKTIGLTGKTGGKMAEFCNTCIKIPETETYRIQECHLPVYHALCSMLEAEFFGEKSA